MKLISRALAVCLFLFIYNIPSVLSQAKLPTGLYKLEDSGRYKLTLDGKTYYAVTPAIATIKNIKTVSVIQDRVRNGFYALNITLDAEGTKNIKEATPFVYKQPQKQFGIVIKGELVLAPQGTTPITNGHLSVDHKSKAKLEQIADGLKAELSK